MAVSRINEAGLNVNQYGNRRLNINGAMQVAQRGTARTVSDGGAEGYQTLDRWYALFSSSAGGVATISQDTTVPSGQGFSNSYKVDVATADTSVDVNHAITIQYRFEAQDIRNSGWDYTNSDSNLSVSFWARSVKAGTYCVFFYTQDGTAKNLVQEYTLEANTWKYVTLRFKGDSGISFDDDNNLGLVVGWTLVAGANRYESVTAGTWITTSSGNGQGRYATSNQVNFFDHVDNNFYLTGVQIEVGDTATDFEHRSYGDELQRCLRYYERWDFPDTGDYSTVIMYNESTSQGRGPLNCTVYKRGDPTFSATASAWGAISTGSSGTAVSISATDLKPWGCRIEITKSNSTLIDGGASYLRCLASGSHIALDAEL